MRSGRSVRVPLVLSAAVMLVLLAALLPCGCPAAAAADPTVAIVSWPSGDGYFAAPHPPWQHDQ